MTFQFENPVFLWLLVLFPAWGVLLFFTRKQQRPSLYYGTLSPLAGVQAGWKIWLNRTVHPLLLLSLGLMVLALARPQLVNSERVINSEGVDIILSIDVSGSMRATDLNPNRLAAAREVARDFIAGREADRIGLVVFAGEAYTQVPLTLDYSMLKSMVQTTTFDEINAGTAVGMALAASINRLRDSEAKSKIVILLTDGRNNSGDIDPITAAELAQSLEIRVYTIGVGKLGEAQIPVKDQYGRTVMVTQEVDVDDETLTKVAEMTGGKYYRATDNQSLRQIYAEIGQLERTTIEIRTYNRYEDVYWWFLLPGAGLLAVLTLLNLTILRTVSLDGNRRLQ